MSDPHGYITVGNHPPVGCDLTPEQAAGIEPIPADPDQHTVICNRRARLYSQVADQVHSPLLAEHLREAAALVADEAMQLVAQYGVEHGVCYEHGDPDAGEDPERLYDWWALETGEVRTG